MRTLHPLFLLATVLLIFSVDCFAQDQAARVFILAGQSNMEGKGSVKTLQLQRQDPIKAKLFSSLFDNEQFRIRDDVYISYLGNHGIRSGQLEIGYATSKQNDRRMFGPELGFGWKMGDALDQPIVLIKTAWGGKSIDRDFRPPSRGLPESIDEYFAKKKEIDENYTRKQCEQEYGHFYRQMIAHIKSVLSDDELKHKFGKMQLSGLVWFQGFNDQFAPTSVEDYEDNLVAFIQDIRNDLDCPDLKFVIGAMGHGGANPKGKVQKIANAQVATAAGFSDGSVQTVRTAEFWDDAADNAFKTHFKDNRELYHAYGGDRPYHYHGSPRFFWKAGIAFGESMLLLLQTEQCP